MESKILQDDEQAMVELHKQMTPEQRLLAFFNHSQLMHKMFQAGEEFRDRSRQEGSESLAKRG